MRPTSAAGPHRVRDGATYVARELGPMALVLAIPAALALGLMLSMDWPSQPGSAPTSTSAPGPYDGFHFEQVGVGVKRLIDDGAGHRPGDRDITHGPRADIVALEPDGSVLTCCDRPSLIFGNTTHYELHRLGDSAPMFRWSTTGLDVDDIEDMAVAPDGTLWAVGGGLASLDVDGWTQRHGKGENQVMEVQEDGTVWADIPGKSPGIVRIRDGKSHVFSPGNGLPEATSEWGPRTTGIASTRDGRVWVGVSATGPKGSGGLLRLDSDGWSIVRPLGRGVSARVEGLAAATDGTLWVYLSRNAREGVGEKRPTSHLARLDQDGWTVFDEADGVPRHRRRYAHDSGSKTLMQAGSDGTVWLAPLTNEHCGRLVSFDRDGSSEHLADGGCVRDLDIDADGQAWASVVWAPWDGAEDWSTGLYLVEP